MIDELPRRRLRDGVRDAALALALWPIWLATAGPLIVIALAADRALLQPSRKVGISSQRNRSR